MSSANGPVSTDGINDILASARRKGVRIWSDNGQLRYQAPKGALAPEDVERLRSARSQIIALLESVSPDLSVEPSLQSSPQRRACAPLTFSQLAFWRTFRLAEQPTIRQIASATRLHGSLSIDALRQSLAEVVRRHDALRTRIVMSDGAPVQSIAPSADCGLETDDLVALSSYRREEEIERVIEEVVLAPIDPAVGPLLAARLLRIDDEEHVLILAMAHMISDGVSMNVLARDLFTAYAQAVQGRAFSLPVIEMQFPDYAVWQANAQRAWIERHGAYWQERLSGCPRLRFPEDRADCEPARTGWGNVPVRIEKSLKMALREWCRLNQTTLVMGIFTAYVGLVLRWCDVTEAVFRCVTHGRTTPKLEHTIGFFASVLYPRIALRDEDSFADLKNRVTAEYCQAYEHNDFYYLASQTPQPEFMRNTFFNWVPAGPAADSADMRGTQGAVTRSTVAVGHVMLRRLELDQEPGILLYDTDDEVVGGVSFPLNRFSRDTMERFASNFLLFLETVTRQGARRVRDISLV